MTRIDSFDPNSVGVKSLGLFGLPFTPEDAQIVLIPAPWGVTVSYGDGTQNGPRAIYDASSQIDYDHPSYGNDTWKLGISMLPLEDWQDAYDEGLRLRHMARQHIESLEHGKDAHDGLTMSNINEACGRFHQRVERSATELLAANKLVGLVGGDHSTPLGLMRALAAKHSDFGILQIDAHCDLRDSYEGFTYSHASIIHNALKIPQVKKLVQVSIRDYSTGEVETIEKAGARIETLFDADIKKHQFEGETWQKIVDVIIKKLPEKVYVSFDIDGLDPALCPHTGTPVPGGLQFHEATYLIQKVVESGKTIVGFDVSEVSPGEDESSSARPSKDTWDANVGMRILWNLAMWTAKSQNLKPDSV